MTQKPIPKVDYGTAETRAPKCDYPLPYGFVKSKVKGKLSDDEVRNIRSRKLRPDEYARMYSRATSTIRHIQAGNLYGDVE